MKKSKKTNTPQFLKFILLILFITVLTAIVFNIKFRQTLVGEAGYRNRVSFNSLAPQSAQNQSDPSQRGSFDVKVFDDSFTDETYGRFRLTVYYPVAVDNQPFPAVVFAHGHGSDKSYYSWIGRHLASWGYVSAIFSSPHPFKNEIEESIEGIKGSIDYLLDKSKQAVELKGMVDENRIAAIGHSKGANASLIAIIDESRIKTAIALAPSYKEEESFSQLVDKIKQSIERGRIPVQMQIGSNDGLCKPENVKKFYDKLTFTKEIVEIKGGNHVGYMSFGVPYLIASRLDKKADISLSEQHQISAQYFTAWLNYHLKGDKLFEKYIFGQEAQKDLQEGTVSYLEFRK